MAKQPNEWTGDQGEDEVTLHRHGVEEGIVVPTLFAWSTLDPNDTSRARYLEEIGEELGTPESMEGEPTTWRHHNRNPRRRGKHQA